MPWADFLGTDAAKCGFEEAVDGKSKKYTGRVYVKWQDYNFGTDTTTLGATRGPMSMWYDVSITVQQTEQSTSSPVGNTETPYNADTFKVLGSTYSKATNGYVTVNFVYEATTNYPYYASLPESATNFLVHGAGNKYGDLTLTGSWLNAYALASDGTNVLDGKHTEAGDTCGLGETCVMRGTLSYTWDPTGASCTLNSASNLQFDLTLDCADNGATNVCGEKMRTALGEEYSNIGAFKLAGNIDFCKTAVSDFPIAWGDTPFGVEGPTTRTIGAQIVTSGTFTSEKKIYAVGLTNYRVKRSDTLIFSLFNKDSVETDKRTTFGKNSAFVYTPTDVDSNGFKWKVEGKFTPNVKVDATAAYDTYMIALPVDNGATLSFTMIIDMRLYTTSATSRRRRLLFRQVEVPALEPAALAEASATTNPISVNVPQNVKVATDGTISFAASSNSLSTGAIAGIAVAGAVVGIAGIALAVFAIRRHKRNAQASESVDSEKAAIEKMAIPAAAAYAKTSTTGQIVA